MGRGASRNGFLAVRRRRGADLGLKNGPKCLQNGFFRAEHGSQRGWKRGKRAGNYEMREKREKWGENGRKRGANYELSEWHEWGAKNGGETTKYAKTRNFGEGRAKMRRNGAGNGLKTAKTGWKLRNTRKTRKMERKQPKTRGELRIERMARMGS